MSTEMRDGRPVRTYRGRSLEELIPRIRDELGPDAIILREREGLMGGFNGFFQQRCVEVDAQAPPSVDFYDDEEPAHPDDAIAPAEPEPEPALERREFEPPEPEVEPRVAEPVAAPPQAAAPVQEPAAAIGWPHERARPAEAPPEAEAAAAAPSPLAPSPYASAAETYAARTPEPPATPDVAAQAPREDPVVAAPDTSRPPAPDGELSFAQRLAAAREERETRLAGPEPEPEFEPEPEPFVAGAPLPEPAVSPARGNLRVVEQPEATVTAMPAASGPGTRRPPSTVRPFPAAATGGAGGQLDSVLAGSIARELTGQGISEAWAHELIVTAAAHLTPFTPGGDLRAGVRSVIAGGIMAPPPLPSTGAAVAFIGPGGSGKTRAGAALAAAYRRASTLQTQVISVGGGPRAADVAGLLADRDISVDLLRGAAAADAIARGRERGLVVLDTDTTSPIDPQGVAALSDTLAPLGLDAVYLTLPATMSATAARGLLDGLEPLQPTALVITHADEAHELGIVAELAYVSGLPIAFIHGGLDLDTALVATDPAGIAARILP